MLTVKKTAKGWKRLQVHTVAAWHWNGVEEEAQTRTLIITKTIDNNPQIKYSFSIGKVDEYKEEKYAHFQSSR